MDFGKIELGVGIVVAIIGGVFALQGAGIIGGSTIMDGNSTYIFLGSFITVMGLVVTAFGMRPSTPKPKKSSQPNENLPVV